MKKEYPAIEFHQFGFGNNKDRLLMFAPLAKDLANWAGIPRKGWHIRMLFQRWITEARENELKSFWKEAISATDPVLGPSAIVVAIQGEPELKDGKIKIEYSSPIEKIVDSKDKLKTLADIVSPKIIRRVQNPQLSEELRNFSKNPLVEKLPDVKHDHIFEFALQLEQMKKDPQWFIHKNNITEPELASLCTAMEALCRPAIVVDGQHRLTGAASVDSDVYLPVIAITHSDWINQIYQFVVINEKAQKVDSELLNDIFASSLTPEEQDSMRTQFKRVKVDIEERIQGSLAGTDEKSPFYKMVTLNLPNPPAGMADAYVSHKIIQNLIQGKGGTKGWRTDDEFYNAFIKNRFPKREDWSDWQTGKWRDYWFAFWWAVIEAFTKKAKAIKGESFEIWNRKEQTNLTKGVGLKMFQRFFMEFQIKKGKEASGTIETIKKHIKNEAERLKAEKEIEESCTISGDIDLFKANITKEILAIFPVRVFTTPWKSSLDDDEGRADLLDTFHRVFLRTQKGEQWRAAGGIFTAEQTRGDEQENDN